MRGPGALRRYFLRPYAINMLMAASLPAVAAPVAQILHLLSGESGIDQPGADVVAREPHPAIVVLVARPGVPVRVEIGGDGDAARLQDAGHLHDRDRRPFDVVQVHVGRQ